MQAPPQHHVFPREHRDWFLDHGVNVDDYCITLPVDHHEAIHAKPPKGAKGKDADAIEVRLEHVSGYSVKVVYPYRLHERKLTLGKAFAVKGTNDVFGPH